jgi:hypothetical protein
MASDEGAFFAFFAASRDTDAHAKTRSDAGETFSFAI